MLDIGDYSGTTDESVTRTLADLWFDSDTYGDWAKHVLRTPIITRAGAYHYTFHFRVAEPVPD